MNKFYKTSYPKVSSINQIIKSKKQAKREIFKKEDLLNHRQDPYRQTTNDFKVKQKFYLENKIQIDPELLFSKNADLTKKTKESERVTDDRNRSISIKDRRTVFEQIEKRKEQNKTETKFYEAESQELAGKSKLRPQSKQESRSRILSAKTTKRAEFNRPKTSKGSRTNINKEQLNSIEDESAEVQDIAVSKNISRKAMTANNTKKKDEGRRKYNFQTSIDDEFLSLFAN